MRAHPKAKASLPAVEVVKFDCSRDWGVVLKLGYLFGGPNNKDYSILGSMLGSPHLRMRRV